MAAVLAEDPGFTVDRGDGTTWRIALSGPWTLGAELPPLGSVLDEAEGVRRLELDGAGLGRWDTGLPAAVLRLRRAAEEAGVELDTSGLPDGARRLLDLAMEKSPPAQADDSHAPRSFVERTGEATLEAMSSTTGALAFLGEMTLSFGRLLVGRARFESRDLVLFLSQAGAKALPIVSLISFLVGVIFAFVGIKQLERFGAGIYVADLVAIAVVREMAGIMTAIIMAGRTGAAFAAQLGTMKVNEEIDALRTFGIAEMDYLVLPRALALVLMMPLLTLYASLLGILGGMVVSVAMMDVSVLQYLTQTQEALDLDALFGGLFKSLVYAIVIAIASCYQGLASGNSAMAVGQATTAAVVSSILLIVISAAILTVVYTTLGI